MRYTAVARGHRDVLELNVHVVLGWSSLANFFDACDNERTFDKFAAIDFTGSNLERDNVALKASAQSSLSMANHLQLLR